MKQTLCLFVVFLVCNLVASQPSAIKPNASHLSSQGFEKNLGQVDGQDKHLVNYFYKTNHLTIFLNEKGLSYQFEKYL